MKEFDSKKIAQEYGFESFESFCSSFNINPKLIEPSHYKGMQKYIAHYDIDRLIKIPKKNWINRYSDKLDSKFKMRFLMVNFGEFIPLTEILENSDKDKIEIQRRVEGRLLRRSDLQDSNIRNQYFDLLCCLKKSNNQGYSVDLIGGEVLKKFFARIFTFRKFNPYLANVVLEESTKKIYLIDLNLVPFRNVNGKFSGFLLAFYAFWEKWTMKFFLYLFQRGYSSESNTANFVTV